MFFIKILSETTHKIYADAFKVFRKNQRCLSLKKVDSQMLKTDAIQLFKQTQSLL